MRERTVVYQDDDYDVTITVRQASYSIGLKRSVMMAKQWKMVRTMEEGAVNPAIVWAILRTYPAVVNATVSIENGEDAKTKLELPTSYEELVELPEVLVAMWENAIYEANPAWVPKMKAEEDAEGEAKEPDSA